MNEEEFSWVARRWIGPYLSELGFELAELRVSGTSALAIFRSSSRELWLSCELVTSALGVYVFSGTGSSISDIDDRVETPRLQDLNRQFMSQVSPEERATNSAYFAGLTRGRSVSREVLRCASD